MRVTSRHSNAIAKRVLLTSLITLVIGIALFALTASPVDAFMTNLVQTTATHFNAGNFFRTGLTTKTSGGGDGDGEVRLMTVGISAAEWKSDGNVTNLPSLQAHAAYQKNSRIYVSGGASPGWGEGTRWVSYTTILSLTTHNVTNWSGTAALPDDIMNHGMVAVGNYMYVLGGSVGNVPTSTVRYALINANGSLGAWQTTTALPAVRASFPTVVVSDTIYVLGGGGILDVPQNTVYSAKPNSNGTITSWSTASANLPVPLSQHAGTTYGGTIYIVGGTDGSNYYPNVYYATPTAGGVVTAWNPGSTTLQQNLILAAGAAFGGQIYFAGGATNNGNTLTNTITSNLLNDDFSPAGSWVNSFVLSTARQQTAAVVSDDGWLYVINGNSGLGINPMRSIDYGPLSASGSNYAQSGTFTSSVIDLGGSYPVSQIDWNTFVSSTVTMTLQYRLGISSDLSGVPWSASAFATISNTLRVTNTLPFSPTSARYVQYRVAMTSTVNSAHTPALNAVAVWYDVPSYPDLIVTNIQAPASSPSNQTVTFPVTIKNQGDGSLFQDQFYMPQPGQPGRQPQIKVLRNGMRVPAAGKFLYVLVYILAPGASAPPSDPSYIIGHCYGTTQSRLDPNQSGNVTIDNTLSPAGAGCAVPAGTHDFYAQVDICDGAENPSEYPDCSTVGHVLEKSEANNVSGVFPSGSGGGGDDGKINFLPFIKK